MYDRTKQITIHYYEWDETFEDAKEEQAFKKLFNDNEIYSFDEYDDRIFQMPGFGWMSAKDAAEEMNELRCEYVEDYYKPNTYSKEAIQDCVDTVECCVIMRAKSNPNILPIDILKEIDHPEVTPEV